VDTIGTVFGGLSPFLGYIHDSPHNYWALGMTKVAGVLIQIESNFDSKLNIF
jgi:hypothetical protein